jgi:hypothetical protein
VPAGGHLRDAGERSPDVVPDPEQWVVAGSRTVDEMAHIWIGMTYFDNPEDFQNVVAERERQRAPAERKTTTSASRD